MRRHIVGNLEQLLLYVVSIGKEIMLPAFGDRCTLAGFETKHSSAWLTFELYPYRNFQVAIVFDVAPHQTNRVW